MASREPSSADPQVLQRALARERRSRREAERLLEAKSRELYEKNEELEETAAAHRRTAIMTSTILENAAEGIITFDEDRTIESANPAAHRIFGYEAQQLVGLNVLKLLGQNTLAIEPDENLILSKSTVSERCLGYRQDGSTFEIELSSSQTEIDDRVLFTWLVRDITNRRQLERQLGLAQKMESVGQLAAGIAHEINTPIQYVGNNTQFLNDAFKKLERLLVVYDRLAEKNRRLGNLPELCSKIEELYTQLNIEFLRLQIPEALEESSHGTSRVAEIVAAMKEFSHPGSGEKIPTDINKAIRGTITIARHEWKYVAKVELDLDDALPKIPCYPGELNQALLNIIVNAAHAISGRDEDLSGIITVRTARTDDGVAITISDTGCGMSEATRERIFEPFFTTKAIGIGTGQGLSIVYSVIVEKHAGSIEVQSEPNSGTTFLIRLPSGDTGETTDKNIKETHVPWLKKR